MQLHPILNQYKIKMAEKKTNVGVSETPYKLLSETIDQKNKEAGTDLYSKRTYVDKLIIEDHKNTFGNNNNQ